MADLQLAPTSSPRTPDGLIPASAIDALAREIAAQFNPERIYLFGSYAYGTPTPDSDVDIMVVMNTDDMMHQAGEIRTAIDVDYPSDILVYTPAYLAERLALGDFFIEQVAAQGIVLYDSGRSIFPYALAHPSVPGPQSEKVGDVYLNKLTAEWVDLAEEDYDLVMYSVQAGRNYRSICYHAQQCAEKYLKAYLQEHGVRFAKTHELTDLLALCIPLDAGFAQLQAAALGMKDYGVDPRYPGFAAGPTKAQVAYQDSLQIRTFVRAKLGI